jgi:lipid-binding SYLF domain-containing protein
LLLGACATAYAADEEKAAAKVSERLTSATAVFQEIMSTPDKGIPEDLLKKAQCVVIIPGAKKGAFIFGATYGQGFITCRASSGEGWTPPGNVRVEGGSFGFQIGGEETDAVMLVMNKSGEEHLLSSQFKLGASGSVAAGPVGRTASANTDAYMNAEILTWSRARGVFAGISLNGATLRQDLDNNRALYGKAVTNKEIVEGQAVERPATAAPLLDELSKYSPEKGMMEKPANAEEEEE